MLKTLDVVKNECRPRPFRQPGDRALEIEPLDPTIRNAPRTPQHLFVKDCRGAALTRLTAFQIVETPVHREAIEPGPDSGIAAKFGELSIGQQKNFLQQILCVGSGAAHPPREVEQPRRMLPIELLESWHISFGHSARLDDLALPRVALARARPPLAGEVSDPSARDHNTLGEQERALGEQIPSEPAQFAAGSDHAMAGD